MQKKLEQESETVREQRLRMERERKSILRIQQTDEHEAVRLDAVRTSMKHLRQKKIELETDIDRELRLRSERERAIE